MEIGRTIYQMTNYAKPITDEHAAELGCAFYLIGEIARITTAIQHGELPSMDTWMDAHVYAQMAMAIRAGHWSLT